MNQASEVKEFFERTDVYFAYNYNLIIRRETVQQFIGDKRFKKVLDMPSGSGEITLPLLSQFDELHLMDFSSNMISLAKDMVPNQDKEKVQFFNKDFYSHDFQGQQYDLIVSLGILAHIENPFQYLEQISNLVAPGGWLILQNTDHNHWFSRLIRIYLGFRRIIGKDKYSLNKVPAQKVHEIMEEQGFSMQKVFRYNQSFLGLSHIFSNELKYRLTRRQYGDAHHNKNASQGSDYTYLFVKKI